MRNSSSDEARNGHNFQQPQQKPNAENDGQIVGQPIGSIVIRNVDLPLFLFDGVVYIQAPLESVVDAFTTEISECLRDLESRISEARGAALSLAGLQYPLFGEELALRIVVPDSWE